MPCLTVSGSVVFGCHLLEAWEWIWRERGDVGENWEEWREEKGRWAAYVSISFGSCPHSCVGLVLPEMKILLVREFASLPKSPTKELAMYCANRH